MKKVLFAALVLLSLASCRDMGINSSAEPQVQEYRRLSGFERIELLGSLDVEYVQADTFSVMVKAPQHIVKWVDTRVEGNKLVVNMRGEGRNFRLVSFDGGDVKVYVTSPDFLGIELKGSGDFKCKHLLDTDNLDISLRGSGNVTFEDVVCDGVKVSLVGSGDIAVKRVVAQRGTVELVGSGDIEMNQKQVAQTKMELKGSGDIKMRLEGCGIVHSRLMGSGDITLSGDVDVLNSYTRGSGDMHTKGLEIRKK